MANWRDGTSTPRTPAQLDTAAAVVGSGAALPGLPNAAVYPAGALFVQTTDQTLYRSTGAAWVAVANPPGFAAADIDAAINVWDDPMGIGFASPCMPWATTNQSAMTANRAVYARAISGGLVNFLKYRVFTQSGNLSFGIFNNVGSGAAARPGSAAWLSGSFACPAATDQSLAVTPGVVVKARQHWFGFSVDNAVASLYQMVVPNQLMEAAAGWGMFRDSVFPLADPAVGGTNGYFRFPIIVGRRT
jgi:hypothetical protein